MKSVNVEAKSITKRRELRECVPLLLRLKSLVFARSQSIFEFGDTSTSSFGSQFVGPDVFKGECEIGLEGGKGEAELLVGGDGGTDLGASLREEGGTGERV